MMPKYPFDDHPEFYQHDNRRHRGFNPVSKHFLETKFRVLLPPEQIKNQHILDLGACYGAAGQWALFYGAASYTGVEIQAAYVKQARQWLAHWDKRAHMVQQDIRSYLAQSHAQAFDLVLVAGVLYHFVDSSTIIEAICRVAKHRVTLESNYPPSMCAGLLPLDCAITEYVPEQEVNLADTKASMLGLAASSSLAALDLFFQLNGFPVAQSLKIPISAETLIYDQSLLGNTGLDIRFAVCYQRDTQALPLKSLEQNLAKQVGKTATWAHDPQAKIRTDAYQQRAKTLEEKEMKGQWRFDANIAQQFEAIAKREIPDYLRVIDLCLQIIGKSPLPQPKIIDVGSALGETLKQLHQRGYYKLYGVECSADMLAQSFDQATLIHAEQFPETYAPFDYVLVNWTLHFIADRKAYLAAIKRSLNAGGVLILTEKINSSACTHELYYDFKRANGVSETDIEQKRQQIEGVLVTYPFSWYLDTLATLGFIDIEIINATPAFMSFMAKNPPSSI